MIKAKCSACKREVTLAPAALARGANCMYCGQKLDIDPDVLASVRESADSGPEPPHVSFVVVCPICERVIGNRASLRSPETSCIYCGCPIVVQDATRKAFPAVRSSQILQPPPDDFESLLEEGLADPRIGGIRADDAGLLPSAVEALVCRSIRGHCTREEADSTLQMMHNVMETTDRNAWSQELSPLPPDITADLLAHTVARNFPKDIVDSPDSSGTTLVVTTDRTIDSDPGMVRRTVASALLSASTISAGYVVLPKAGSGETGESEILHILKIAMTPVPEGSRLSYTAQLSTGEGVEFSDVDRQIVENVPPALKDASNDLLALKAVYGSWFGMNALRSVKPNALETWLGELDCSEPRPIVDVVMKHKCL